MAVAAKDAPAKNKKRSVQGAARRAGESRKSTITAAKACKIAKDGKVRGKPLSEKAMRFMRARCGDAKK